MNKQSLSALLGLAVVGASVTPAIAAEPDTIDLTTGGLNPNGVISGELVSCFDYYQFGSVQVDITEDREDYEPGDPVILRGEVRNTNPYPLVGVDVYARLIKDIPNANDQASTQTIDEFVLAEDITLAAGEEYEISESYVLSTIAPAGEYQMIFFVAQKDKFNMSGLTFTDDIYASRVRFNVGGDNGAGVYLDQTRTQVGGQAHQNMGFITQHQSADDVEVTIPLRNTTSEEQVVTVAYSLYSWDGLQEQNLLRYFEEDVALAAGSEQTLSQTMANAYLPVYYLKVEAIPQDQTQAAWEKSVSNIRLAFTDKVQSRLNFSGLTSYRDGTDPMLVTCFHNTNNGVDPSVTVTTELLNARGNVIGKTEYRGDVTGNIAAVATQVDESKLTNTTVLKSVVKDSNGDVVDQVSITYDCADIDSSLCKNETILTGGGRNVLALVALALIGFLLGAAVYLQRGVLGKKN